MFQSKLPHVGTTIFTVMSQLAARHGAVNLGQGFPDFEGPEELHAGIEKHRRLGRNQYAPMTGVAALREQIARKIADLYGRTVDADAEVTVTSGATEALYAAIAAVVHPGEEVILLDPCYDSYEPAVLLNGGVPVHVPLTEGSFRLDHERLAAAITPKTRLIVLNTPHNPSGATLTEADLAFLRELVARHDLYLLGDEVYEHILFDGRVHQSLLRDEALYARSFVVSSFGKTYHITGWKLGYCVAPPALSVEFRKVHQYLTFCSFHAAQWALADYMAADTGFHLELSAFYQQRRDHFAARLAPSRFRLLPVEGAYFQLVDYSAISDEDDVGFCRRLVAEHGVAAIPVSVFYQSPPAGQRLIRLCFAKQEATLDAGAERLCAI
ncbi:MAG: pyridoxal phosphate-dependent aminotransferase [Xanthomonadales bacterium]|jgi:methionine aminotransferase|nr:pyridoxal phosphate-dependent aminotransferase [Xanthomonadales bacterium]